MGDEGCLLCVFLNLICILCGNVLLLCLTLSHNQCHHFIALQIHFLCVETNSGTWLRRLCWGCFSKDGEMFISTSTFSSFLVYMHVVVSVKLYDCVAWWKCVRVAAGGDVLSPVLNALDRTSVPSGLHLHLFSSCIVSLA